MGHLNSYAVGFVNPQNMLVKRKCDRPVTFAFICVLVERLGAMLEHLRLILNACVSLIGACVHMIRLACGVSLIL